MKMPTLITALGLVLAAPAFAAGDKHEHAHEHQALHGGVVVEAKDIDYELVARPALIQLYLRDHGKPVDVAQAGAKLTLLSGSHKQEVDLKPAGDRLEAAGSFKLGPGTKAVAALTRAGKPAGTVRFVIK